MSEHTSYKQRVGLLACILVLSAIAFYQRIIRPLANKAAEIANLETNARGTGGQDLVELKSQLARLENRLGTTRADENDRQQAILTTLGEYCKLHGTELVAAQPEFRTQREGMSMTTSKITLSGSLHALLRTIHAWETSDRPPARLVSLDLNTRAGGNRPKPALHADLIFRTVSRSDQ